MDIDRFTESPVGTLVPIRGFDPRFNEEYAHWAFLPRPLPSEVQLRSDTWAKASEAAVALGRLKEASSRLPNPSVFRTPALRREAVSTSALEGTYAPFEAVLKAEAEPDVPRSPQVREILNYVTAANHAFRWIAERPLSFSMLAEVQDLLVRGTSGERPDTGRRRESIVIIGPQDARVGDARFIPPPADDRLEAGIEKWVEWVINPPRLPVVVECALSHYQFETLHPFSDGNGRIGRLVIVLELMLRGVLDEPVLTVSPWLEERRERYQAELLALSMTGDWDPWVNFFAVRGSQSRRSDDRPDRCSGTVEGSDARAASRRADHGCGPRARGDTDLGTTGDCEVGPFDLQHLESGSAQRDQPPRVDRDPRAPLAAGLIPSRLVLP